MGRAGTRCLTKKGFQTCVRNFHNLDLGQVRAVMERLASFLDAATTHTSVELEHQLDYLAERQREYGGAW